MCCCVGEYRARIMACSVIFHAITIGVPPKRDQQAIANQATFDICQMTEQKLRQRSRLKAC